ncbi:MAG: DUF5317 domain-containing protein [Solirubrobacterales bacterium]
MSITLSTPAVSTRALAYAMRRPPKTTAVGERSTSGAFPGSVACPSSAGEATGLDFSGRGREDTAPGATTFPMPIVLVILGLAVIAGVFAGGSLRFLERFRIHWWALAPIALALQLIPAPRGSADREALAVTMLVASYVLLLAVVAVNRRVPGAPLMALGLTLNLAVVGLNGGMPVSSAAVRTAGADGAIVIEDGAKHHLMTDADVLRPLADVIPVPQPFGVVLSIGDVLLYTGMAWWCFTVTRGRFPENRRPPARRLQRYRGLHSPEEYRLPARYRRAPAPAPLRAARSGTSR